jgi:hypothetical protein
MDLAEAFARRRGGGRVVIEHVHVYKGGRAFVGAVTAEGGGTTSSQT